MNDRWFVFMSIIAGFITFSFSYISYEYRDKDKFRSLGRSIFFNVKLLEASNAIYIKKEEQTWLKTLLNPFKMKKVI